MDVHSEKDEVILLFDKYTMDSRRLQASFKRAGCKYIAAVIEDDGFLPESVMSVYGYFMEDVRGMPRGKCILTKLRYWKRISVKIIDVIEQEEK